VPAEVKDEEAARLLAVLNTNSHELGEWGGSGFFPLACLSEHSCEVNVSCLPPSTHAHPPTHPAPKHAHTMRTLPTCTYARTHTHTHAHTHTHTCTNILTHTLTNTHTHTHTHTHQANCAFSTSGTELWVTVVQRVKSGAPLSIDYCDATFEPTAVRQAHLLEDYGFECVRLLNPKS